MYRTYPKPNRKPFTVEEIERGDTALYTDYECPGCGKVQSVANTGGYGHPCLRCGLSSNPAKAARGDNA